jgi:hypothetical protein
MKAIDKLQIVADNLKIASELPPSIKKKMDEAKSPEAKHHVQEVYLHGKKHNELSHKLKTTDYGLDPEHKRSEDLHNSNAHKASATAHAASFDAEQAEHDPSKSKIEKGNLHTKASDLHQIAAQLHPRDSSISKKHFDLKNNHISRGYNHTKPQP